MTIQKNWRVSASSEKSILHFEINCHSRIKTKIADLKYINKRYVRGISLQIINSESTYSHEIYQYIYVLIYALYY